MNGEKQDRMLEIFFRGLRGEDLYVRKLAREYEIDRARLQREKEREDERQQKFRELWEREISVRECELDYKEDKLIEQKKRIRNKKIPYNLCKKCKKISKLKKKSHE